nr:immunoglobulin heavy chain junction region [Macaca mulatta]
CTRDLDGFSYVGEFARFDVW